MFLFFGNISATICKNLIFKFFHLVRKVFLICAKSDTFDGAGKPEPLKNDKSGLWSRRINDKDRLVYSVNNDFIIVYQCKGHYDD